MATLNTLRTKGGTILAVIIGLSLLAFLLGDFASSGGTLMNASKMNVGEVNGENVPYQLYLSRVEQLTQVQQIASGTDVLSEEQQESVKSQAWEQIVREKSFDPGMKALGFAVSAEEEIDMAGGAYVSPVLASIFSNPQTGMFDKAILQQYVANINNDVTGRARFFWNYLTTEMNQERMMSKYLSLVAKGMFVTNLEVEQGVQNANNYYTAEVVSVPYTQIADSLAKVSEADLKAYYKSYNRMFRQAEARDIEYVIFDAVPSAKDYEDAQKYIASLAEEFKTTDNVQQFVSLNSQAPFDQRYYKAADMPAGMGEFAFSAAQNDLYGPVFENDVYTMARVADIREIPDTIGAKHILVPAEKQALADSLVGALKDGGNFAVLSAQYSLDQNSNSRGGDLGRFDPNDMIPAFSEAAIQAKQGDIFTVTTPYGIHVVELTYKGASQRKAQLAVVNYKVESSNQTQQQVYAQATKFASDINSDVEKFNNAVREGALSKRVARLKSSDRNVPGIEQSTELVRWAFGAEAGDISTVITIGEKNIVALVTSVREMGIAPFEQVRAEIVPMATALKKGEMLVKEMGPIASLDQLAQKYNTDVKVSTGINFSMFYAPEIGVEPEVIGAITGLKENTISKPIDGYSGVYVVKVTGKEVKSEVDAASERAMLQTAAETDIQGRIYNAVFQMGNIHDMRIKFF